MRKTPRIFRTRLAKNEPLAGSRNPAHLYPSESEIVGKIANLHEITPINLLLTSGGDNALDVIIRSVAKGGGKVILLNPDFVRYAHWSISSDLDIISIDLNGLNPAFPEKEIFSKCDGTVKLIIISTVGNPTGYILPKGFINRFHSAFPHVMILIDEVYSSFTGDDYSAVASRTDNIVSLRSLSKLGGPGLRVGYIIGTPYAISKMKPFVLAHPVAGPCYDPALKILNSARPFDKLVQEQIMAREWAVTEIRKIGFAVEDSRANWIHIYMGDNADNFYNELQQKGIDVLNHRHPKLLGWLRVTTPNIDLMKKFIEEVENIATENLPKIYQENLSLSLNNN